MNSEIHRCADATNPSVVLLPPEILLPTEDVPASRFEEVSEHLLAVGVRQPILVEQASLVVMGGHHRRVRTGERVCPCLFRACYCPTPT
ncbi:hypothetical protein [Burkholderia sp. SIMBA_062]|uniref:hypothetical protein n=1 Tax=Burkholderia sp. SIMBA_062 TaxID=3085803 RepID=UPI00397CC816